ncbi:hypothetical protein FQA39_LY17046 [Lamprigera yunnana]|nr:hypothetical protein FQA39_LY17046 [Lamprigera yunnana]
MKKTETQNEFSKMFFKAPPKFNDNTEKLWYQYLTPFAFQQQLANSENIIDAPVAHSQNDEQVVVSTSIENYEIPNNYDEPDQQLANSENIMNAPVETNEVQGNKDTQTQAQTVRK